MSYTSGTNYRSIKNFSGSRGTIGKLQSTAFANNYGKLNTSKTSNSNSSNTDMNILTVQLKTYSKLAQNSAKEVQESGTKLTATGDSSLFGKAEKSGSTKSVVSEATDFVNNYNSMLSSINELGGTENRQFLASLKQYAQDNKDALKQAGITVLTDGSLIMNKKDMSAASLDSLKAVLNSKDSFAAKVTDLSSDIEANVQKKLKENMSIIGSNIKNSSSSGSYFNYFA
ncbi:hypothetical protein Ami103574_13305 [Aminipila butyrica]|uniref:Flagellar hook-associated protein 2 C-terminus n=1 Tax=Aminipila butyrica TaxID=433296 RepID=A0A858BYL1_9FIRM|nr:hypothetical protein [Aminipila butyrica]QIB70208.1 hypothetical protein Ami103574_13305 [Aminipila butyrica]